MAKSSGGGGRKGRSVGTVYAQNVWTRSMAQDTATQALHAYERTFAPGGGGADQPWAAESLKNIRAELRRRGNPQRARAATSADLFGLADAVGWR